MDTPPRGAARRYYVTGVTEGADQLVIQIIYVGDDFEAAVTAGNAARADHDRVLLKDRDSHAVEL